MRCDEIMKKDIECISPDDSVQDAAKKMRDEKIGFLPVCKDGMKAIGTITDRDLAIRVLAEGKDGNLKVGDVASHEVIFCRPEDNLRRAEELMAKHHKSRILCIDDQERLCGVISLSDVAQHDGNHAHKTLTQVSEREARM